MDSTPFNDRSTWAWNETVLWTDMATRGGYQINPEDRHSFYRWTDDGAHASLYQCETETATDRLVFDPSLNACVPPSAITEQQIYEWAVSKGAVTDQR
jgi:hypothetical protein